MRENLTRTLELSLGEWLSRQKSKAEKVSRALAVKSVTEYNAGHEYGFEELEKQA